MTERCQQHPTAPVIGGMCGGCTQYPADMVKPPAPATTEPGLVDEEGALICACTYGERCPNCRD